MDLAVNLKQQLNITSKKGSFNFNKSNNYGGKALVLHQKLKNVVRKKLWKKLRKATEEATEEAADEE